MTVHGLYQGALIALIEQADLPQLPVGNVRDLLGAAMGGQGEVGLTKYFLSPDRPAEVS